MTDFLEDMNLDVSAFDSLGSLMSSLGGDDVELEEYFSLLFNNSQAVSLLAQSVRPDPDAQQAVIDSLETNTEVIINITAEITGTELPNNEGDISAGCFPGL